MKSIQLSLFPQRGFGFVGIPGIVEDWRTGEPLFTRTRAAARRMAKSLSWGEPRVVRIARHENSDDEGRATFVISE